MAGEWRRASEAYGVSYGIHPYGMLAPVHRQNVGVEPSTERDEGLESRQNVAAEATTTETTVDGTLSIGRWVVRLQLLIRRSHRG
jgi:hypothetical protein